MRTIDIEPIVRVLFSIAIVVVFIGGVVLGLVSRLAFEDVVAGRLPSESLSSTQLIASAVYQLALLLAAGCVGSAWYEILRHRGPAPKRPPTVGVLLVIVGSVIGVLRVIPLQSTSGSGPSFDEWGRWLWVQALGLFGWPLIVLGSV